MNKDQQANDASLGIQSLLSTFNTLSAVSILSTFNNVVIGLPRWFSWRNRLFLALGKKSRHRWTDTPSYRYARTHLKIFTSFFPSLLLPSRFVAPIFIDHVRIPLRSRHFCLALFSHLEAWWKMAGENSTMTLADCLQKILSIYTYLLRIALRP